ncbi:RNA polymerase sigma factor (sigma-70 family) [Mucilaginibacter sp. UYP25]|uniref:RNA polymerase sigma factor n=1 Tax=unclassified Mucilaginibacter TaxID=2617802 RepID=UPI0033916124
MKMMMTTVDNRLQTLWDGCLRNDRKQQEMLYKVLAPKMLAVCLRYAKDKDEAQDILQEGFIKMFKNMGNYRGEGSLEGWIRRIMVHSAISRYRKAKNVVLVEDFAEQGIPVSSSYNDNGLEARDLMNMVQQLPDTYRSVFNMYAIEGFSHQEIGSKLGMSELLSRTTLHRARTILKEKLNSLAIRERHCMAG